MLANNDNEQNYSILCVLTDGQLTDLDLALEELQKSAHLPSSVELDLDLICSSGFNLLCGLWKCRKFLDEFLVNLMEFSHLEVHF